MLVTLDITITQKHSNSNAHNCTKANKGKDLEPRSKFWSLCQ